MEGKEHADDVFPDIMVVSLHGGDQEFFFASAAFFFQVGSNDFNPSFITSPATISSGRKYSPP